MAAMATKFGLDPSTTSIEIGQDKDGMPTVIASFVGPDSKQQQKILVLLSMLWVRCLCKK
jgi:hypothetical protein